MDGTKHVMQAAYKPAYNCIKPTAHKIRSCDWLGMLQSCKPCRKVDLTPDPYVKLTQVSLGSDQRLHPLPWVWTGFCPHTETVISLADKAIIQWAQGVGSHGRELCNSQPLQWKWGGVNTTTTASIHNTAVYHCDVYFNCSAENNAGGKLISSWLVRKNANNMSYKNGSMISKHISNISIRMIYNMWRRVTFITVRCRWSRPFKPSRGYMSAWWHTPWASSQCSVVEG